MRRLKLLALVITGVSIVLGLIAFVAEITNTNVSVFELTAAVFNVTCSLVITIDVLLLLAGALGWVRGVATKQQDLKTGSGALFVVASVCIITATVIWALVALGRPSLKDSFRLVPVRPDAVTIDR